MIYPIQFSARAEAIFVSVGRSLDLFVASLLAATTHTIHRSRRWIFPAVVHPLFELPRKDRLARDDGEKA